MNTGADVSYLLKAREALNESEKAEREGRAKEAVSNARRAIAGLQRWVFDIEQKEAA